jgi:integrase
LNWRAVNLATRTLRVGKAKTDAGSFREVDLPVGLVQALTDWKLLRPGAGNAPLFVTRSGKRQTVQNVDRRIKTAIRAANVRLDKLGIEPISERVTPHSLRRTYASIRAAAGDNVVTIAEQGGWEDPTFALRVYAKAVKRRDKITGPYAQEFDRAIEWAEMGRNAIATECEAIPAQNGNSPIPHNQAIIRHAGR